MQDADIVVNTLFQLGPVAITQTVVVTWVIMAILGVGGWLLSRRLKPEPGMVQTAVEGIVQSVESAVKEVLPQQEKSVIPFILTLWVFLITANLAGLIPGLHAPTRDLSATAALAMLVFMSVHWFGIGSQGLKRYLRHYLLPSPILLPFHLISEITRTIALAVRLFGNMMSLELVALMVLLVAGFLVPVPILMLHVVEALVQAYIFGMLALVYIAGAIQFQALRQAPP